VNIFGGSGALDDVVDRGYFAQKDYTVSAGPGTYLLTANINITGKVSSSHQAMAVVIRRLIVTRPMVSSSPPTMYSLRASP